MRMIAIIIALFVTGAASRYIHELMPTALAAATDILLFIGIYVLISRAIKAYLGE